MDIRFAGFGGQGIVMAAYILGRAAILAGRNALQTQSYGSEACGGACKSDVAISDEEVFELAPAELDVLVALSQPALDKYWANLRNDRILIFDRDLVKPPGDRAGGFGLPATNIAHQTFGLDVLASVIMLGALVARTDVVSHEALCRAIGDSVPPKTVDVNLKAFEEGYRRGKWVAGREAGGVQGSPPKR
jgi:2-oxoglutarate ferredoxin oxidoreductase subunit gamma